jgi:hypothetical protein
VLQFRKAGLCRLCENRGKSDREAASSTVRPFS